MVRPWCRVQVGANLWKRVDRRRMDELREEIGMQMSLTVRLLKFRLRWAGHLVWMGRERENSREQVG